MPTRPKGKPLGNDKKMAVLSSLVGHVAQPVYGIFERKHSTFSHPVSAGWLFELSQISQALPIVWLIQFASKFRIDLEGTPKRTLHFLHIITRNG